MANIMTGRTMYDVKLIPKDSEVEVTFEAGVSAGTEVNTDVLPDSGYVFDIAYFEIITPADAEANIILYTKEGNYMLLADNQSSGTDEIYDASDWAGLDGLVKFTVYAKAVNDITTAESVVVKYSGRMVRA